MVVVHVAPNAPYNEKWGYQENILPKYHKKMGHDVTLITTCSMHQDGKIIETKEVDKYLEDGVRLIRRRQNQYCHPVITNCMAYISIFDLLIEINPDFIFFHGLISYSIMDVVRFKKMKPSCVVVQDNHQDYNIGFDAFTFRRKVVRSWYRYLNRKSIRYVDKVYGVTPWRKAYAADYFRIPQEKLDVLIMGADDEKIHLSEKREIRMQIRSQYGIDDNTFVIVTGGKIDKKKKIDILAKACENIMSVKLLIFGQIETECEQYFHNLFKQEHNVIYIGWIDADKVYDYYFAADLVFFPGQHSVLWEQACASKTPCVFARWNGMDHVDVGGNCDFIDTVDEDNIQRKIRALLFTPKYASMKKIAESDATDAFLYSKIAEKSMECCICRNKT